MIILHCMQYSYSSCINSYSNVESVCMVYILKCTQNPYVQYIRSLFVRLHVRLFCPNVMWLRTCTWGCHAATYMYMYMYMGMSCGYIHVHVHGDVMQLHVVHTCTWGCHAATYTGKVSNQVPMTILIHCLGFGILQILLQLVYVYTLHVLAVQWITVYIDNNWDW